MLDFCIKLLIFFIITTSFIKPTGVTVLRPKAVSAVLDSGTLQIAIRPTREIWMDRQHVDIRDVRARMERLHIERPDDTVIIIADRESKAGDVAKVMDEVRSAGIKNVSIAADPGL